MTVSLFQADDSEWREAVSEAISELSEGGREARVFQEEREDLRVVVTERGVVERTRSFASGVSIRFGESPPTEAWMAAATPEQLLGLSRAMRGTGRPPPHGAAPPVEGRAGSPPRRIEEAAHDLHAAFSRRVRGEAGWAGAVEASAFSQRVRVATSGRPARADSREGGWLRLEVRGLRGGRRGLSVVELVLDRPAKPDYAGIVEKTVERAEARMESHPVDPRTSVAVFAPGVGGILLHEILGHALEGDVLLEGASWLAGRQDPIAPPTVTVLDDPRQGRGAWRIDDEGEEARATPLVREGRVVGALLDRGSARRLSRPPTGHGRRSSFRDPVIPRMGATFLAPGPAPSIAAVEAVRRGVYVRRMSGARCDPATGLAVFRVSDADAIEQGRLSHPVHPFLMEVSGPRSLPTIDAIASELSFDPCVGSCQRLGQPLSTSVGAPTYRLELITVHSPQELEA